MQLKSVFRTAAGRGASLVLLLLLLAAAILLSLSVGSLKLPLSEIISTLWNRPEGVNYQILFNIRLPRILLGAMVGGCFAVAGAILQGVMRNPLASPAIRSAARSGGILRIARDGAARLSARMETRREPRQTDSRRSCGFGNARCVQQHHSALQRGTRGRNPRFLHRLALGTELASDPAGRALHAVRVSRGVLARRKTQHPRARR